MWFNFFKEFILWISDIDARLLLIVNGAHSPFFDSVMWCISGRWIWVPFYAVLAYLLFRRMSWKRASICLVTIGLIILAADQTCATLIRPEIGRLRPANLNNPLSSFVHVVNGYRGGRYGFPSCHAANTFALAVFMSLVIRHKWFTVMMCSRGRSSLATRECISVFITLATSSVVPLSVRSLPSSSIIYKTICSNV